MLRSLAVIFCTVIPFIIASNAPDWMLQSWFFDWDAPGSLFPVPVTAQCETIHITWQRGSATGPDGVSPYYLQIYTSNYAFPFILPAGPDPKADVTIPFAPGTLYQICMFDSNGNNGGCQDVYTVYANPNTTTTCSNFTMPTNTLSAKLESPAGPLSPYGWIPSCTDLSVTPQSGTPPFTLTIAPSLHPPLNITSNDMSPIKWTVSLSWSSSFFVSLVDAKGITWSAGLLHSGSGDTSCLSGSGSNKLGISVGATVGAAVGGLLVGTALSILFMLLVFRRRNSARPMKRRISGMHLGESEDHIEPYRFPRTSSALSSPPAVDGTTFPSPVHISSTSHPGKHRSRMPSEYTSASVHTLGEEHEVDHDAFTSSASGNGEDPGTLLQLTPVIRRPESGINGMQTHSRNPSRSPSIAGELNQVYVIHHDSGRAPVSVITSAGTEVVELPPGYSQDFMPSQSSSRSARSKSRPTSHLRIPES
ncbi:hypothetical protein M422DRAFT_67256 [Sphaerobolus stellatus SS14]|uniref:Fibronectin type-III domain-containing protein n=1 Tax=Sphaerobolus stellatus (strain SS14) TaxID=990650 RepID=A0A0C9VDG5_SPHS4|nr:hypothetical protein M422DRAFT_67256 [Sphaerobolus stellatus SS14]